MRLLISLVYLTCNSSRNINFFSLADMALVNSSVDVWNPCQVLDVYPHSAKSTCVGVNNGTEVRCGWMLVPNRQFSASQLAVAAKQLKSMAARHPSDVTFAEIRALVQNTLCGIHQWQTSTVEDRWRERIDRVVPERGGMRETRRAVKHSQREVAEETDPFDLNEVKKACDALEASQARCSEQMMEKTDRLAGDQAANLALLRREMAELRTDAARREEELNAKVDGLKAETESRHASLEKDAAAVSKATQRLRTGTAQINGMLTTNNLELAGLKGKARDLDAALEKAARRTEESADELRGQLADRTRELARLRQTTACLEDRARASETEAESLRQGLRRSHAALEEAAKSSSSSSSYHHERLTASLQALDQKLTQSQDEHVARTAAVGRERDRTIESLVARVEELTSREKKGDNDNDGGSRKWWSWRRKGRR